MSAEVVALEDRAQERRLRELADELEETGWAFEIADAQWRLFRVEQALQAALRVGPGGSASAACSRPATAPRTRWCRRHRTRWIERNGPFMLHDDPKLAETAGRRRAGGHRAAREARAQACPVALGVGDRVRRARVHSRLLYLGERLVDDHGTTFGYVLLYGPSLPASVLGLLTRRRPGLHPHGRAGRAGPPPGRSAVRGPRGLRRGLAAAAERRRTSS